MVLAGVSTALATAAAVVAATAALAAIIQASRMHKRDSAELRRSRQSEQLRRISNDISDLCRAAQDNATPDGLIIVADELGDLPARDWSPYKTVRKQLQASLAAYDAVPGSTSLVACHGVAFDSIVRVDDMLGRALKAFDEIIAVTHLGEVPPQTPCRDKA